MFTYSRWKHTRFWAVIAPDGSLVCLCVYRKGAKELIRRLDAPKRPPPEGPST